MKIKTKTNSKPKQTLREVLSEILTVLESDLPTKSEFLLSEFAENPEWLAFIAEWRGLACRRLEKRAVIVEKLIEDGGEGEEGEKADATCKGFQTPIVPLTYIRVLANVEFLRSALITSDAEILREVFNRYLTTKTTGNTVIRLLLHSSAIVPTSKSITTALKVGNFRAIAALLKDGRATPEKSHLVYAIEEGKGECLKLFLADSRFDPWVTDDLTRLFFGVHMIKCEIFEILLGDTRINPHALFITAITEDIPEYVELCLKSPRVDPCYNQNECFLAVLHSQSIEALEMLLADGRADPSATEHGDSLLYQCLETESEDEDSDEEGEGEEEYELLYPLTKALLKDGRLTPSTAFVQKAIQLNGSALQLIPLCLGHPKFTPETLRPLLTTEQVSREVILESLHRIE